MSTIEQITEQYATALNSMDAYTVSLAIDEFVNAVADLHAPEYTPVSRMSYQMGYMVMLTATMAKNPNPIGYLAGAIVHSGVKVKSIEAKIVQLG